MKFLLLPVLVLSLSSELYGGNKTNRDFFISFDLENNIFEREAVLATLTLHSRQPKIVFSEMLEPPGLENGQFDFIRNVNTSARSYKEDIDGETYFAIPLKSFVISIHEKGTYRLSGGKFKIGVVERYAYDDPFWGRRVAERVIPVEVDVEPLKFKIKGLPTSSGGAFSGLVGDFEIETQIPSGDIILNEVASAIIKVSGKGLIGEGILPDYSKAFSKGVKLKSMSESRNIFFDGEAPVSELVLECEFVANSKDAEIGSVEIDFFNPEKAKFEKVASDIKKLEIKSITSKIETIDI